jgi:inner membrane protein
VATSFALPTRSIGLKFLLVCLLALAMAAPIGFVWAVSHDRQSRWEGVRADLGRQEGGQQTLIGPVLVVPYAKDIKQDNKIITQQGEAVAFAQHGEAKAQVSATTRKKGIYTIPVYQSATDFRAAFDPALSAAALREADPGARFDFAAARLEIGVSNTVGMLEDPVLTLADGSTRPFKPVGTGGDDRSSAGISLMAASAGDLAQGRAAFPAAVTVKLSGAERFGIGAFAQDTAVHIEGNWPDVSYEGVFRAAGHAAQPGGFAANWRAPFTRRGIAETAMDFSALNAAGNQDFAVRFLDPTTVYTGVDRALKYAMMFIGLVFLAYFMFEIVSGARAHPAQYVMVGLAQAVFYLLLLAFAERLGFLLAFVVAAGATIALISLYVVSVFKHRRYLWPAIAVFTLVYALMYVLMTLEDYALLVGAVMSFAALAVLMYLTRDVAWYGADRRDEG